MTALEKQHTYRTTLTPCPRCRLQPGSHDWGPSWLNEISISDGMQAVHALVCRRPSCAFAEILGIRTPQPQIPVTSARRSWFRDAIGRHPLTFAAAAVVNGIAFGLLIALT